MLLGQYNSVINEKNRVAIPKKFRGELGAKIIVARWYEGCIAAVSQGRWQEFLIRLTGISSSITQTIRDTDRFILGSAFEVEPDSQGRVVIPKTLVNYAKLKSQVVFLGLRDRVELWNDSEWRRREKFVARNAVEFMEKIAKKGD